MTLLTVPCAVCGGTRFHLIYPATLSDPAAEPASYYSSSRTRAGHLDIVRCADCGLLFTNPRDDDATLARVYASLQDATYDVEEHNRRRTARAFLELVQRYQPKPARLIDVGCASGVFVEVAQQAGWRVTGLEASAWASTQAQQRVPGATIVTGLLENVSFSPASFEVATLWDVLEHVRSPRETLERVREWLTPDGWLFFNLPDADSRMARWLGKHWVLLLREHLWYFSPATFARLLQSCGLDLVQVRPNTVHFSLANVLGRMAQYPGLAGNMARRLYRWRVLRWLNVRFPMGEMKVAVRRHV
jgi:SAM-dependent methyltransferase